MLHIIKSVSALSEAVTVCNEQDELLLMEDAVYVVNPQHIGYPQLKGYKVSVLAPDLAARAVTYRVSPQVTIVDYVGFVKLTVEHPQSLTWD